MDFVEFIFEDNVLNEIFENKFPSKITRYTVNVLSHSLAKYFLRRETITVITMIYYLLDIKLLHEN